MQRAELDAPSLQDCMDEYLLYIENIRGFSSHSVDAYRTDLAHCAAMLGADRDFSSITIEDLHSCVAALRKQRYSITSINRFIASVRGLFAYAQKFQYIPFNVALELKTLKAPKRLPRFMTQAEVDQMCQAPLKHDLLWTARDRAIFEMLYSSGCRVGELARLTFQDFSADYKSALVLGKGKKERTVFFAEDARKALREYLLERAQRFPLCERNAVHEVANVFINQQGTALTEHGIWYIVKRYSGVEGTNKPVTPHTFRHTFATAMLTNGADVRVLQEMLGHSNINTTQIYTHVTTERLKEVYDQAFPHSGKED